MDEIFISYSRGDSQFVDGLIRDLERKGIHVWVDREDIEGGTAWRAAISDAIRQCRAFLIVLSPNSTRSKNVLRGQSARQTTPARLRSQRRGHQSWSGRSRRQICKWPESDASR